MRCDVTFQTSSMRKKRSTPLFALGRVQVSETVGLYSDEPFDTQRLNQDIIRLCIFGKLQKQIK